MPPSLRGAVGGGLLAAAIVTPCAAARRAPPSDWRAVITGDDRDRLRDWRGTFTDALAQARAAGFDPVIDAEGASLQPDAAIAPVTAPDGDYRCRVIKLGHPGAIGLSYVAYPAFRCRMGDGMLVKLDGSQRPAGRLYAFDDTRMVFLGAMTLGDEAGLGRYGRDPERDMAGMLERIGPARWRLILPRPRWESLLDVVELAPSDR